MREIKFRYYDSKNKIMWKVRSIDFSNGYAQLESDGNRFVDNCLRCGKEHKCYTPFMYIELSELMQYTGLKDKNEEVYEGDILELPDWTCYKTKKYVVKIPQFFYDIYEDQLGECSSKIIGNIYENPELLKTI